LHFNQKAQIPLSNLYAVIAHEKNGVFFRLEVDDE